MAHDVIERLKSAMVGDVTAYGTRQFVMRKNHADAPQSGCGRIYHDPEVISKTSTSQKVALAPLALPLKAWKKICSIGEYDATKTR